MPFDPNIKVEESGEKISADSNVAEQADKITPTMPEDSPEATAGLTDSDREQLWDAYHSSPTLKELTDKLAPMNVPDAVKHAIWQTKLASQPAQSHQDKIVDVLNKMHEFTQTPEGKQQLDVAEKHPLVFKILMGHKG